MRDMEGATFEGARKDHLTGSEGKKLSAEQ